MHKSKKTGIGHNKQFGKFIFNSNAHLVLPPAGPIQKLAVPDFQHISNHYEQLQNEILEKPGKKR